MTRVATGKRKSNIITIERKALHSRTSLILDSDKCAGCNLCWTICPRYAIERGPIGASLRNRSAAAPIRINYYRCIFCGLCAYICPFNALELQINERPAEKIKQGVTLPFLEGEEVFIKRTNDFALKFFEGKIEIDNDKCPGGCSTCIDVCPSQCLSLQIASKEKPWEKQPKIAINREKCLFCGACLFACPAPGAITLERTEIKCSDEGTEGKIWKNIEEKLKKLVSSRYWFYEERVKTSPRGEPKLAPKRRELKESS